MPEPHVYVWCSRVWDKACIILFISQQNLTLSVYPGIDGGRTKSASSHPTQSKMGSRPASAEQEEAPKEPTPVPECSVFMIAVDFLLEVKATQVGLCVLNIIIYCIGIYNIVKKMSLFIIGLGYISIMLITLSDSFEVRDNDIFNGMNNLYC